MSLQGTMERSTLLVVFVLCLYSIPSTFGKNTKTVNSNGKGDNILITLPRHSRTTSYSTLSTNGIYSDTTTGTLTTQTKNPPSTEEPPRGTASSIKPTSTTAIPTTTQEPSSNCPQEYSCINSTTARICAPSADDNNPLVEIATITCALNSSCDFSTGSCVPDPVTPASPVPEMFTCMRDGDYPDVNNCSRYFRCVEELPYLLECSGDYPYYSPKTGECQDYYSYCAQSSLCEGYSGTKVLITPTINMFAYCENEEVLVVDRCLSGYRFNSSSQSCERHCTVGGLFPSGEDCAQYFACSSDNGYVMSSVFTCPEGKAFLEDAHDCVDRSLVANCQVPAGSFS